MPPLASGWGCGVESGTGEQAILSFNHPQHFISITSREISMAVAPAKKSELLRFIELDTERLALGRQVTAIEKEMAGIKPKIMELVRTEGAKGALTKWGYNLLIKMVRNAVKWKDEFIKLTSADQAAALAEEQSEYEKLVVEKAP